MKAPLLSWFPVSLWYPWMLDWLSWNHGVITWLMHHASSSRFVSMGCVNIWLWMLLMVPMLKIIIYRTEETKNVKFFKLSWYYSAENYICLYVIRFFFLRTGQKIHNTENWLSLVVMSWEKSIFIKRSIDVFLDGQTRHQHCFYENLCQKL